MIPTFKLNHKNIDTAGSRLLFQSKIDNPGHGRIIWAPYLFTLEKSYFSIESDAVCNVPAIRTLCRNVPSQREQFYVNRCELFIVLKNWW